VSIWANIFPARQVDSPQAIFSVTSGSARQIRRNRSTAAVSDRPIGRCLGCPDVVRDPRFGGEAIRLVFDGMQAPRGPCRS